MPLAQAVAQVGGQLQKVVDEEREKVAEIQTNEALVRLRSARDAALYDPKQGVLTLQRANALDAPTRFSEAWSRDVSAIAAGIKDPEARRRFTMKAEQERVEAESMVLRHVDTETERLDADTTKLRAEALAQDALAFAGTAQADGKIAEREALVRGRLSRQGIVGEAQDAAIAQDRSKVRLAQVEALAEREDVDGASSLLERVRGEMVGTDVQSANALVQRVGLDVRSQRASDNLFAAFGPDDEQAAIREAERQFEGAMRDRVVQRLEVAYGRERRFKRETLESYTNQAMTDAYAGRPVNREARTWLEANNYGNVLEAAGRVQKSAVEGEPVQTNLATYQELRNLLLPENRTKFLETNLLEYSDRISRSDLQEFIDAQVALRGGTTRPSAGVSTSTVLTETFRQAQSSGMFTNADTFGQIEQFPADKETFNVLRGAVEQAIAAEREVKGELSQPQVREVIRQTLDGFVLEQRGFPGFRRGVAVPVTEAQPSTLAEREIVRLGGTVTAAKVGAILALRDRTDLTPEQKRAEAARIARGQ